MPKNVITRSLGPEVDIEVDIEGPLAVKPGDAFLLCSDGLSGPVDDHEIGAFAGNFHPRDACRYLVSLANSARRARQHHPRSDRQDRPMGRSRFGRSARGLLTISVNGGMNAREGRMGITPGRALQSVAPRGAHA